eukprot:1564978-Amphidinium_carterae.1
MTCGCCIKAPYALSKGRGGRDIKFVSDSTSCQADDPGPSTWLAALYVESRSEIAERLAKKEGI